MASDILIVDDEADIREMVAGFLQDDGHRTRLARDSDEALKAIEERRPQLVILDIWLQGSRLDGLEVLNIAKKAHPGPAGDHHFRPRQHRDRRHRHQARRLRLHREAVQGRPPAAGDDAGAGGLQAAPRGARAARALGGELRYDRQLGRHQPAARRRSTAWRRPTAACSFAAPPAPARSCARA